MAMLVAPASPPSPTPTPTLASTFAAIQLQPRQTGGLYDYGYGDCFNYNNILQCSSILNGCYDDIGRATDYNAVATSCFCNYGVSYLDCYVSKVATGSCASYLGITDWGDYQRDFYISYCGSIPASVMGQIQAPTSVSLNFQSVKVVTASGDLPQPNYSGKPDYSGQGDLLQGGCTQTGFTQVDAGGTVYFAGFVGCINDRPECCPYAVDTAKAGSTATAAGNAQDMVNLGFDFPQPASSDLAVQAKCADDYYSISGGCCPNGFWPFTSAVGGQTPCWSSIGKVTAPALTVESDATAKAKPTSAVVNIVWSMRYPVADSSSGGLSTAAKAGIGAGAGVAAILIAGLAICLWRYRRKNKKLQDIKQGIPPPGTLPQTEQQQQQMMMQHPAPPGTYPLAGAFAPDAGKLSPDGTSIVTTTATGPPSVLVPQHTGTSAGGVSELSSSQGGGGQGFLMHNGQPAAGYNPRVSHSSNGSIDGTPSPAVNGQGYPAPIAEADEGPHQQYGYPPQQQQQQYGYPPQQQQQYGYPPQQQPPQQYYATPPAHEMAGTQQGQYYPPQQGYAYPQQYPQQQQQQQQQQYYPPQQQQQNAGVPEMSAQREAEPPQEVMGSQVGVSGEVPGQVKGSSGQ